MQRACSSCSIASGGWWGSASSASTAKLQIGDRHATALEREPAKPSHRAALVAIGIVLSQHQADAQRVVEGDLWKLACRGEDEIRVVGR